jgi:transglutaminase-like putative cysteine protease
LPNQLNERIFLFSHTPELNRYLAFSNYIDGDHRAVASQARILAAGCTSEEEVVQSCFEFVRDKIKHSWDFKLNPVTCRASEALIHGTGYCYAKSHLLAALLRSNGIPAGLCYQRLSVGMEGPPFCLHGLNAVYLKNHGWYRIDARGNKSGVDARFTPPLERLAFPVLAEQERDLPEIWEEPLPLVVHALSAYSSVRELAENLPDIELISAP